ncbi:cupin domain-containing protein [Sinomicrobium weinanense]|uniref:Cupin domain-containing protein n=1 Tax=Sinomicrobium weinanense TaxID=2842200 RepID=A0A926JRA3_9FLAO|nr:cupin domain-containing protein [Sinomicrobium weinanense]MBC9795919.1 cupin domain-containing protein [Sinomicrobium weinanense]MBU3124702.1 cupin domain-containing protein [Sinomicrobium weinanense]
MEEQKNNSEGFFISAETPWERVDEGIERQFVGYDDRMMMVKVKFEKGAVGYIHHHYHSQATYVASGVFKITINGKNKTLRKGDGFFIPSDVPHGAECLEAGMLIDVFSPAREDFMEAIQKGK